MFTKRFVTLGVFAVLAAAGSGLLLAQSPQGVGTWVGVGSADNPFGNGASVALTDGRILIAGGAGPDGAATNVVSTFDTATSQFAIAGTLLSARTEHTATLLKDGRVLVTGGTTNSLVSTDIEIFDPSTGASTLVAQMAEPRRGHVAALLQSGSVVIAGGYTSEGAILQSAFIFDPETSAVSPTPAGMNVARASASATSLIDGRVVIIGGTDGTNDLASAEIYDPALQSFTTVSTQLSVARRGHSAVLLPHNGSVLVAGGTSNGAAQAGSDLFLPAEFPDPFSWGAGQFAPTASMSAARSRATTGPMAYEGYAVVTGGGSNSVERYRFATIKTDQDDYTPGEYALITGTGWQPGEQVTLRFQEDPAVHEDYVLTLTANGQGNISTSEWAPELHDLNVRFYLMATGQQSGRRAQTTFTDANSFTVSPLTQTVTAGTTNNFTWTLTAANSGNEATTTFTIPSAWPVPQLAGPNQVTVTGCTSGFTIGAGAQNRVITITQSGSAGNGRCGQNQTLVISYLNVVAPTPAGSSQTYTFDIDDAATDPTVTVTAPANTPPVITEGASANVNMSEDGAPTLFSLTLNATDAENNTLTWSISSPALNGTASASGTGNSKAIGYTPASNYNGSDSFVVQVSDGNGGTDTITVNVTITAVNDQPDFTAVNPAAVNEDSGAQTVNAWATFQPGGGSDEASQTPTYVVTGVGNPGLFAAAPVVSSNGTLTYTPAPNAFGTSTFDVYVQDNGGTSPGVDTSGTKTFTITVNGVNDVPSFTSGGDVTSNEDLAYSATWATAINAGPNESGQALTFSITNNSNTALFSVQPAIASDGTLTYTPTANAFGTATITVRLSDNGGTANGGSDMSPPVTFTITVNSVNDAPSFTSGGGVTVLEDSGAYSAGWATAISAGPANESGQTLTFNVTNNTNTALFSVQPAIAPNGTLTFTPAADAFGTATITVTLSDNGGTANSGVDTSAAQTFTITVTGVNDAPSFTSGGDVTVNEDSPAHNATWATAISAGPNETGQALTFTVTNDNNALFSGQPAIAANGTLTFTPAANAFGSAQVTVTLTDDGGTANGGINTSPSQQFTITVNAVNDAPSFTSGGAVTVLEDSAAYNAGWATAISAGPANESGQTLTFNITNNTNSALFSVQPAIAPNGTLTFTPAADAFGTATITVTLSDNGGTANGGVDTSAAQTFTITVTGVNDAPSFTSGGNVTVSEDSPPYNAAWATAISAGPNESGQTLTFTVTNSNNPLFSGQPAIAANGTLTFTPAANAFGTAQVTVTLSDNGGTANGGVDTSAAVTFTITVSAVNDAPANLSLSVTPASINEGASTSLSGSFTDVEATDAHTVVINWGDGTMNTTLNLAAGVLTIPATVHTYADDNPTNTPSDVYTITVTVTDNSSTQTPPNPRSVGATTNVTVNNVTPTLALSAPADGALYPVGTPVALTTLITDPGADTFTCKINWDDPANPALDTFTQTAKNCNRSRTFTQAGVYTIVITMNDDDQPAVTDTKSVMVIVYDPSAGFVTGGGTIWSPLGAYVLNPALEGKANFGFVSKYHKGAKTPTGQTEFQFHAGGLNFHGDVYQWLVVSGAKAQYKGTGTLNGAPGYGFQLTATDGQLSGGGGVDKFRIKITAPITGAVVYDNVYGINVPSDDIDTSGQQNIQTGSIVIHSK